MGKVPIMLGFIFFVLTVLLALHLYNKSKNDSNKIVSAVEEKLSLTDSELKQLSPKIHVKAFSFPQTLDRPDGTRTFISSQHKYPLKEYIVQLNIADKNSTPPNDCRIRFYFPYILKEIKALPSAMGNNPTEVSFSRFYSEKPNGETNITEKLPLDTKLLENFTFAIHKINKNGKTLNTNIAELHCEKWPRNTNFAARVVVDLSKKLNLLEEPEKINHFEGSYWYQIKEQSFEEEVKGDIQHPNNIVLAPTLKGRMNPLDLLSQEGTFTTNLKSLLPPQKGTIFEITGDYYYFIFGIRDSGIFANRNDVLLEMPFSELNSKEQDTEFSVGWSSNNLTLTWHKGDNVIKQEKIDTKEVVIPRNLIDWATNSF